MNMESPQERQGVGKVYAADYEKRPRELVQIIKDAEELLGKIKHMPGLRPEAVSKIFSDQTTILEEAKKELKAIQSANEEEITKHYRKGTV